MKKTFKLMAAALAVALVFSSCKDDIPDEPPPDPNAVTGSFTIGTTTYNFQSAFVEKYGQDPASHAGYNLDLILLSDGLTVVSSGGVPDSIYGQGASIFLESFTSEANTLADGAYAFSDTEPHPLFTFSDFSDVGEGDYTTFNIDFSDVTGGTYTIITLSDGRRNVTFDLNLSNGKKLTGTFWGPISYF